MNCELHDEQTYFESMDQALRARDINSVRHLLKPGYYISGTTFDVAKSFLPNVLVEMEDHQRKEFYAAERFRYLK